MTFTFSLVGDLNSGGVANILDAIILADAFDSTPSSLSWNPKADLNGANVVNILEAIILVRYFGLGS